MRAMDAVLFDLDDTLHDDTASYRTTARRVARYVADRFDIDPQALAEAYLASLGQFWEELSPESLAVRSQNLHARWWGQAFAQFGIRDRELAGWCAFAFEQASPRDLSLFPGVADMLADLRHRGLKLGLVTNGLAQTHRKKIALLGLESAFDEYFLADEIGMVKPDPRIFVHACERLGTSAERAAMVGDVYERDIVGAREAGLFTVWVNANRGDIPRNLPQPDATVSRIADAPGVLPLARD